MDSIRHLLKFPVRRKLFFALLYGCEGAPIGFLWWMLPAYLRSAGTALETITLLTSILLLPWIVKFLWAPFIDSCLSEQWGYTSWITASQLMMAAALLPLLFLDAAAHPGIMLGLLLLHSVAAATQDVAIDALCISQVPEQEMGSVNGWMQAGMLTGRSLFGGGALITAALFSIQTMLTAMITLILLTTVLVFIQQVPVPHIRRHRSGEFWRVMREIGSRPSTWYAAGFALLGGMAFEGVGIVAGPFLIDRDVPTVYVGLLFSIGTVSAMSGGAVIGGVISDRKGILRSVRWMTLFMASAVVLLAVVDQTVTIYRTTALIGGLLLVYGSIGMFTASTYALFMSLSDRRIGATQFSAYMGATNGCEAIAGFSAGRMVPLMGYPSTFLILAVVSAASIVFLVQLKHPKHQETASV